MAIPHKKRIGFSLILTLVILSLFTRIDFGHASPEPYVDVSIIGNNAIFVSEYITVSIISNVALVNVSIYDGSGILVQSDMVEANTTFPYHPSGYGSFTIRASIEDRYYETWFWVQDKRSLAIASAQTLWVHQGIAYDLSTVVVAGKISTYTLKATLEGKTLEIEWLSEVFTKLKPTTVAIQANTAGLIYIKTWSDKNKVDSWIMSTNAGIKIRVNGTLQASTTFKWNYKSVSGIILYQLEAFGMKTDSGNLIYDYSDMNSRSVGCTSTLDKTGLKLDVILATKFDVDPTIFEDGFETGNFNEWDDIHYGSSTFAVTDTKPHTGDYSAFANITGSSGGASCWAHKTLSSPPSTLYHRAYYYFDEVTSGKYYRMGGIFHSGNDEPVVAPNFYSNATGYYVCIQYGTDASGRWGIFTPWVLIDSFLDAWVCVEVKVLHNAGSGEVRIYINGVEKQAVTGLDNDALTATTASIGIVDSGSWIAGYLWMDCCVVDDEYIGVESSGTDYPVALTQAIGFASSLLVQWSSYITVTQAIASSYAVKAQALFTSQVTQTIGSTYTSLVQTVFTVLISQSIGFVPLVGVLLSLHDIVVDLTQTIGTSFVSSVITIFRIPLSQAIGSTYAVLIGSQFMAGLSLAMSATTLIFSQLGTMGYVVDLTLGMAISIVTSIQHLNLSGAFDLGSMGFIFAIVALIIAITAFANRD